MTKEELEEATGQELIDARNYCGVDGYYRDYLENVNAEMLKRFNRLAELEKENTELKERACESMWHKLSEKYPDVDKLVRVRTKYGEEYICETYDYMPAEDEIGYGTILTQFEQLDGDWVDDNEIEYWCYIEPFSENPNK